LRGSLGAHGRVAVIQNADTFVAAEEAEAGMAQMSKVYAETGREWYMGAGDRERD
jgi:phosphomethylpyrimidine synthase